MSFLYLNDYSSVVSMLCEGMAVSGIIVSSEAFGVNGCNKCHKSRRIKASLGPLKSVGHDSVAGVLEGVDYARWERHCQLTPRPLQSGGGGGCVWILWFKGLF